MKSNDVNSTKAGVDPKYIKAPQSAILAAGVFKMIDTRPGFTGNIGSVYLKVQL